MIYKYASLGMLALAGVAMAVPASAQASKTIVLNDVEQTTNDSDCVIGKFSDAELVGVVRSLASKALRGDGNPTPKMFKIMDRNMKKCAGKQRWVADRKADMAAYTILVLTRSGMALTLNEQGLDPDKIDTWFDAQDDAFKTTDLEALNENDSEKFGIRVVEGATKAGFAPDVIEENMELLGGYVATSIIIENLITGKPLVRS